MVQMLNATGNIIPPTFCDWEFGSPPTRQTVFGDTSRGRDGALHSARGDMTSRAPYTARAEEEDGSMRTSRDAPLRTARDLPQASPRRESSLSARTGREALAPARTGRDALCRNQTFFGITPDFELDQ